MLRRKQKDGSTVLEGGGLSLSEMVDIFHPVNSILITADNVNPGTRFSGTTWVAWGAGRAVVGVGSNGANTYSAEQTFGADFVTLTGAQSGVNSHTHAHSLSNPYHNHTQPAHTHEVDWNYVSGVNPSGSGYNFAVSIGGTFNTVGADSSGNTEAAGNDSTYGASTSVIVGTVDAISGPTGATSHENRQSSIATYLWKRSA